MEVAASESGQEGLRPARGRFYQARLIVLLGLLLVISVWWSRVRLEEAKPVDWSEPHFVQVCPLISPGVDEDALAGSLRSAGKELDAWLMAQRFRWEGGLSAPARFHVEKAQSLPHSPPDLPSPDEGMLGRWKKTRGFLSFFEDQGRRFSTPPGDASRVFLVVYPDSEAGRWFGRHSVATTRGRVGFVFASSDEESWGNALCVLVHETLHTVGAQDHRDVHGFPAWPEGHADPDRKPRYPQRHAEIMALGIPSSPTDERRPRSLDDVLLGETTAREIGWLSPE